MRGMRKRKSIHTTLAHEDVPLRTSCDRAASWATSPVVRRAMQGNKSRDTKPEIDVRCAVHALGMRYRVAARPIAELRRTADLVFRRARVAVFVDCCFWHGCPPHRSQPKSHAAYWAIKIKATMPADLPTTSVAEPVGGRQS